MVYLPYSINQIPCMKYKIHFFLKNININVNFFVFTIFYASRYNQVQVYSYKNNIIFVVTILIIKLIINNN